jgi:hypothetical protein
MMTATAAAAAMKKVRGRNLLIELVVLSLQDIVAVGYTYNLTRMSPFMSMILIYL